MNENKSKMALISFILGIFGALTAACAGFGCPFAAAAIIIGGIAKKHDPENKQAKIGQLLGIIGCVITFIFVIVFCTILANNGG